jgi:hypothetical protein
MNIWSSFGNLGANSQTKLEGELQCSVVNNRKRHLGKNLARFKPYHPSDKKITAILKYQF